MDASYKTAFYLAECIETRTFCREVPVSGKMSEVYWEILAQQDEKLKGGRAKTKGLALGSDHMVDSR